jgi:putative ubiquitin-RnfH superfamily antitoxin RatB of RatAB toxin-antitoxin module
VRDAVKMSTIKQFFPEIDLDNCDLGVFGKAVPTSYELLDGDRIEIYRPLIADPKEVRRQRAEQGLKTKKGGGKVDG